MDEQITLYTNDVRPSLITESFPADLANDWQLSPYAQRVSAAQFS